MVREYIILCQMRIRELRVNCALKVMHFALMATDKVRLSDKMSVLMKNPKKSAYLIDIRI